MPVTSVKELGPEFENLPEEGKRLAVSLMNKMEGQGIVGDAARLKVLGIIKQMYVPGADGSWQEKQASKIKVAFFTSLVMPMAIGGAINAAGRVFGQNVAGTLGSVVNKGMGMMSLYGIGKDTFGAMKENSQNVTPTMKIGSAAGAQSTGDGKMKRKMDEYAVKLAMIGLVRDVYLDCLDNDKPIKVSRYSGEKVASVSVMSSKEFLGAFPNLNNMMKVGSDRISGIIDRLTPILAVMGTTMGGKALYDSMKRRSAYKDMFAVYPDLNDANQERVERLYNMLQNYAPTVAKDGIGAGAIIKNLLNYPDAVDLGTINSLIGIEKGMAQGGLGNRFLEGMMGAAGQDIVKPTGPETFDAKLRWAQDHKSDIGGLDDNTSRIMKF